MKSATLITILTALGLSNFGQASRLSYAEAEAFCGDLGVMNTTNVPAGVDPEAVRTCREHPAGALQKKSIDKRDCWFKDSLGCSKDGWCYKSCAQPGSGEWCWTAHNDGFGDWIKCSSRNDCHASDKCGAGGCKACGCSC